VHDTTAAAHSIDDEMYAVDGLARLTSTSLVAGETYYFKALPYNNTDVGELADALAVEFEYNNLSMVPPAVENLKANGVSEDATFGQSIEFTWDPKGIGIEEVLVSPTQLDGYLYGKIYGWYVDEFVYIDDIRQGKGGLVEFFNEWTYTPEATNEKNIPEIIRFEIVNIANNLTSPAVSIDVELAPIVTGEVTIIGIGATIVNS
jgi:hypothetical protein